MMYIRVYLGGRILMILIECSATRRAAGQDFRKEKGFAPALDTKGLSCYRNGV